MKWLTDAPEKCGAVISDAQFQLLSLCGFLSQKPADFHPTSPLVSQPTPSFVAESTQSIVSASLVHDGSDDKANASDG